jgi:hypothetical protein
VPSFSENNYTSKHGKRKEAKKGKIVKKRLIAKKNHFLSVN